MNISYNLVFLSLITLIVKLCDGRKILKPSDTWVQQNFIFDKDAILGADVEDEHLIFPDDLRSDLTKTRQGPVAQLLVCIFQGCPDLTLTTTAASPTDSTTTGSSSSSTITTSSSATTKAASSMTTTVTSSSATMTSDLIPSARRRRPIKFKTNGYCKNPPKKHIDDKYTSKDTEAQAADDSEAEE
ncbi:hypothetical protein PVAND_012076 [Polypedilum vanderplanki]|uniref:Uncharacterized protein n=1 Tax=Polypedilum vanderplanki TaxID=319348 RepID=A0A9J6CLM5_POLVA|nr:hypothetical protein PVAND_012076 [Polypedilum vanderplanki]